MRGKILKVKCGKLLSWKVKKIEVKLKDNERIDDLEFKGLKIIQNKDGFCFGMDSVLISDFSKTIKNDSIVADLGTGTGIISVLLSGKTKLKKIYGIEVQTEVAEMAKRSIELNSLEEKIEIINDNLKNLGKYLKKESLDAIVTNPPYQKNDTGLKSEDKRHLISRHEIECTLEDIINISKMYLKDKGEMYIVHRPERLVDILYLLRSYKIEPKEIRFVNPKAKQKPNMVLIKAVKNGKEFLKVREPLIVYNEDGTYTEEILKIYGKI